MTDPRRLTDAALAEIGERPVDERIYFWQVDIRDLLAHIAWQAEQLAEAEAAESRWVQRHDALLARVLAAEGQAAGMEAALRAITGALSTLTLNMAKNPEAARAWQIAYNALVEFGGTHGAE